MKAREFSPLEKALGHRFRRRELLVHANESTYIPAGHRHRLSNAGNEPLVIIEVQTGDYVEEDDIVRFDDVYGRS